MDAKMIEKNKLDLEYQSLLQERNAILIALAGIPLTFLNISITVLRLDLFPASAASAVIAIVFWDLKKEWDGKLKSKTAELYKILKM